MLNENNFVDITRYITQIQNRLTMLSDIYVRRGDNDYDNIITKKNANNSFHKYSLPQIYNDSDDQTFRFCRKYFWK